MMTKSYVEMLAFGESKVGACQKGEILKKVPENELLDTLMEEIEKL